MKAAKINTYLIFIATSGVLLGRAYQHLFFEAPYRAFFLDEGSFGWVIKFFSKQSWLEYATNLTTDHSILKYGQTVGIIFLIATIALFVAKRFKMGSTILLSLSSILLFFMAYCYYLDHSYQFAQILEYAAQILSPILFLLLVVWKRLNTFHYLIRIAIAATFVGHGLYALGIFYPVPGHFVHMIVSNLPVLNSKALEFLKLAGWLDMVVAVGIFIPKVDRYVLFYAFIWGFLTSLARLTTYVSLDHMFGLSLHLYGFEFAIRIAHFLLPLIAFLFTFDKEEESTTSSS